MEKKPGPLFWIVFLTYPYMFPRKSSVIHCFSNPSYTIKLHGNLYFPIARAPNKIKLHEFTCFKKATRDKHLHCGSGSGSGGGGGGGGTQSQHTPPPSHSLAKQPAAQPGPTCFQQYTQRIRRLPGRCPQRSHFPTIMKRLEPMHNAWPVLR